MSKDSQFEELVGQIEQFADKMRLVAFGFSLVPIVIAGAVYRFAPLVALVVAVFGYFYALGLFVFFVQRTKLRYYVLSKHWIWLSWILAVPLNRLTRLLLPNELSFFLVLIPLLAIGWMTNHWRSGRFEIELKAHLRQWLGLLSLKVLDIALWRFPKSGTSK